MFYLRREIILVLGKWAELAFRVNIDYKLMQATIFIESEALCVVANLKKYPSSVNLQLRTMLR